MNPKLPNLYPGVVNRLPLATTAAGLAAIAMTLSGCTESKPGAVATETVTAPASPSGEASKDAAAEGTQAPKDQDGSTSAAPNAEQHTNKPNGNDSASKPQESQSAPQASKSAAAKPVQPKLDFYVTGDCQKDGELQNWSQNFTPHGSTYNLIRQPDGHIYQGLKHGGNGYADGMGHSEWQWLCEDKDQQGTYKGTITDLGPDNVYDTADDRTVTYTFSTVSPNS